MVSRSRALFHNNFRFFKFLLISSNKELTKEHNFFFPLHSHHISLINFFSIATFIYIFRMRKILILKC